MKPVDLQRLLELTGLNDQAVQQNYDQRDSEMRRIMELAGMKKEAVDPTDDIIRYRQGDQSVTTADIARASQQPLDGPTQTRPTATADTPTTAAAEVPNAQDFGSEKPVAVTTPVPSPQEPEVKPLPVATAPAAPYRGSAGSQAIQKLNPEITDVNKIRAGQQFKLPGGGTYTVKAGDTLDAIARRTAAQPGVNARPAAAADTSSDPRRGRSNGQTPAVRTQPSTLSPMVQNAMPGATLRQQAGLPPMIPSSSSASTPVATQPAAPARTPPASIQRNAEQLRNRMAGRGQNTP